MPTKAIPYVKVLVHAICLSGFLWLLWQYHTGAMQNWADPVNDITHITGQWGLWILLASLAVTPLRRLHPKLGNLIRFRRLIGLYAFFYVTLHLATYLFLYSGYDLPAAVHGARSGHPGQLWTQWVAVWPTVLDDLKKRRFIQVGLLSWVILLALAVTSPLAVLRAMGGKNWQRLHRTVYVAAAAACIHFWWLVKAGVKEPLPATLLLTVLLLARVAYTGWKRYKTVGVRKAATSG